MPDLLDPITAVTAACPADAYAALASHGAMLWQEERQLWVATREASVRAVLEHPACRVRPVGQPAPEVLAGTAAGHVFTRLARMNDGAYHRQAREAIVTTLDSTDLAEVRRLTRHWTRRLRTSHAARLAFDVPVHVVGALLGIDDDRLASVTPWVRRFSEGLAPHARAEAVARGIAGARLLQAECSELFDEAANGSMFWRLRTACARVGLEDREVVIANAIGLLFQAHDATAGLIGNTIVHLAARADAIEAKSPLAPQVMDIVRSVSRQDPSIQNTRRFAADDVTIDGESIPAGAQILVLLAGDNCESTGSWQFGHGRHACPGSAIALTIAAACVEALIREGAIPVEAPSPMAYLNLPNARIPVLAGFTEPTR